MAGRSPGGGGRGPSSAGDVQRHVGGAAHFGRWRFSPPRPAHRAALPAPYRRSTQEAHADLRHRSHPRARGAADENTGKGQTTISVQDYAKTGSIERQVAPHGQPRSSSRRSSARSPVPERMAVRGPAVAPAGVCRGRSHPGSRTRPDGGGPPGQFSACRRHARPEHGTAGDRPRLPSLLRPCARGSPPCTARRRVVGDVSSDDRGAGARKGACPCGDNGENAASDRLLPVAPPDQIHSPRGTSARLAGAEARTQGGDSPAAGRSGRPNDRAPVGARCCRSQAAGLPRRSRLVPRYASAAPHGAGACPVGFGSRGCGGSPVPHKNEGPDREDDLVRAD